MLKEEEDPGACLGYEDGFECDTAFDMLNEEEGADARSK